MMRVQEMYDHIIQNIRILGHDFVQKLAEVLLLIILDC